MSLVEPTFRISQSIKKFAIVWLVCTILIFAALLVTPLPTAHASRQENNPPDAVIDSPENAGVYGVGEVVHFDASSSSDPDNDQLYYAWDFGDGETGTGVTTSHIYAQPWVHVVTLEVSDGELNDTARVVIVIGTGGGQNRPPTANLSQPQNGDTFDVYEQIFFDGSTSSDPEDDPLTYFWHFGDGNATDIQIGEETNTHAYNSTGAYTVTLTVSDGVYVDMDRVTIFVNNTPPIADAGEDMEGYRNQQLIFDGSNSTDPDRRGSIVNYTWDMDDRSVLFGEMITYSFIQYGTYRVELTVTDDHGAYDSDEVMVQISNAPPVASMILITEDTVVNTDLEFDASNSYDPDGSVEEFTFDFGDGSQTDWIENPRVTHRYNSIHIYDVTLLVKDDNNEVSDPFVIQVDITEKVNNPPAVDIRVPSPNDQVAGVVNIEGAASDEDSNIESVEVKIDQGSWLMATITASKENAVNWEYSWDTQLLEDGVHTIFARAYDGKKYSQEQSIKVTVNNRPTTYIEITEKLEPEITLPEQDVKVSGTAKYDTNVPVKNTNVKIELPEIGKSWTTKTDSKGKYSHEFNAPTEPGEYEVTVFITDGALQRSNKQTLNVQTPPDLYLSSDDISFRITGEKPVEKDQVRIAATIHNSGDVAAKGKVVFYQDTTNNPFQTVNVNVPKKGSVLVSATWIAREGAHSIIVVISDIDPTDADSSNNRASKEISVGKAGEVTEEESQMGVLDRLFELPTMYRYAIIGAVVGVIILILLVAAAVKSKSKAKKAKQEPLRDGRVRGPMDIGEGKSRTVVFQPIDAKEKQAKSGKEKTIVKFETIDSQ